MICDGLGQGRGHCCVIGGQVCHYLTFVGDQPRCGKLLELGSWDAVHRDKNWKRSRVGEWFKTHHPGFGCGDWPQNIPEAMGSPSGKCCWQVD